MKISKKKSKQNDLPPWVPKLLILAIVSVLVTLFVVSILFQLTDLLSWIIVALFLSFALEPLVYQLTNRGWNRKAATATVMATFLAVLLLAIGSMVPLVINQIQEIIRQSPAWIATLTEYYNNIAGTDISKNEAINSLVVSEQFINNYVTDLAGNVVNFSGQVLFGVLKVLTILLFTFYLVLDGPHLRRLICSFLSAKNQKLVLDTWELAIDKTGGFMVSRLVLGAISAVASFIVLSILGIPFALPLAIWMGVVSQFLPIIGTYIAAAVPLLMALLQGVGDAVILLAFIVIYQQIENYILAPKVAAHTMHLHPAIAFGAVIAGASLGGVIGAFLALPVAAMLQEMFRIYTKRNKVIESELIPDPQQES